MFVLLIFARQAGTEHASAGISWIFLFAAWMFAILTVVVPTLPLTCTSFGWPRSISELLPFGVENASAGSVDGEGPVFEPPTISGRKIDACIRSPQFPELTGLQCIRPAQKEIADAYCQLAGYRRATDNFRIQDTGHFQSSLKYVQEVSSNGVLAGRGSYDNTGGTIFVRIACHR